MNSPQENSAAQGNSTPSSLSDRVRGLRLPQRQHPPAQGRVWLPWLLCLILAGSTAFFALRGETAPDDKRSEGTRTLAPQAPRVGAQDDIALEAKGYIIPVSLIQVSPKVSGMVMELLIEEGMKVKENDPLARLERTEYEHELSRAQGLVDAARHRLIELTDYREQEVRQVKAELEDSNAQREQLYLEWRRAIELKASRALAPREYEQAVSAYKSMDFRVQKLKLAHELMLKGPRDERIESARAELKQAEAEWAKAKWKYDNCEVRAPVTGTILTKRAEKGAMVNPAAFSNGLAASLCDMADLTNMEVDLAIAERDIGRIIVDQRCKIRAEAFRDRVYHGRVSRIMPTGDRAKGAVPVRVKIEIPREEEGMYLRPEMGAIVTFLNTK